MVEGASVKISFYCFQCGSTFSPNLRSGILFFFFRGGKERLIQLLDYSSVASPESGLFSDWSRLTKGCLEPAPKKKGRLIAGYPFTINRAPYETF